MAQLKTNETIGGIMMVSSMIIALILSNTTNWYFELVNFPIYAEESLKDFVKEFLMIIFFVSIGMELKKEFQEGLLANHKQIILPAIATIGGMIVPALVYLAVNINYPENYAGFAIPCATDIAFAICLFNLLGKNLSPSIRIFLLSIAIFDDLGAILIIALFYSNNFDLLWLIASLLPLIGFWIADSESTYLYILFSVALSLFFYKAGISTSVAGFLIGFLWPLYKKSGEGFSKILAPKLQPIVQFFILPIFAFTSSGIVFSVEQLTSAFDPIVVGIVLGLLFGKQIGITLFSYVALRLKLAELPESSKFFDIYTVSIYAGIGFTMSLYVGMIAFHETHTQNLVKIGVLLALIICVLFAGIAKKISIINDK
jgi:NhaA family Na+:H+ antiporter